MTAKELKEKYIKFFEKRGHKLLPNVSLVPEDDSSTLFISAGMQPLVPYFSGRSHPLGKRLVSLQRCLRTVDIENVGNVFHNTFFEMLGNWSLGDYWKKESLSWSLEFLTKILELDPKRLHVTVFEGDKIAPKDEESMKIWLSLGISQERIYPLPKEDNWWELGETGPGGPDSEIFYDIGKPACGPNCRPGDNCGRFFEMWNNVFIEYNRKQDGSYEKLKQKNVDTGMGVERTSVVLQEVNNVFQTDVFVPIIKKIEKISGQSYQEEKNKKAMRIIADHLRAAVFVIADGVVPSNKDQGYVLRRLIRKAIRHGKLLQIDGMFTAKIARVVIDSYGDAYSSLFREASSEARSGSARGSRSAGQSIEVKIFNQLNQEEKKFSKTLDRGLREIGKHKILDGKIAFYLYESYGIPLEMVQEIAQERGQKVEKETFEKEFKKHQELSRAGAKQKFAGGLADHSETVIKYHTATHLLQAALRKVLGEHIYQVGSNLTGKRARFDFFHPKKLTEEELKKVEDLANQKIRENLPVTREVMDFEKAQKEGALLVPGRTYPKRVYIYKIGPSARLRRAPRSELGTKAQSSRSGQAFSLEVCGGPHVTKTGEIGRIKIVKEEGIGEGRRRIYLKISNF